MKRTVTRWMCRGRRGALPLGQVAYKSRRGADHNRWGTETVVRVTITYDDGLPAPRRAKRKGGK